MNITTTVCQFCKDDEGLIGITTNEDSCVYVECPISETDQHICKACLVELKPLVEKQNDT